MDDRAVGKRRIDRDDAFPAFETGPDVEPRLVADEPDRAPQAHDRGAWGEPGRASVESGSEPAEIVVGHDSLAPTGPRPSRTRKLGLERAAADFDRMAAGSDRHLD